MEKIAVHCPTKELAKKVSSKLGASSYPDNDNWFPDVCICLDGSGFDEEKDAVSGGYRIITAEEYLGEQVFKVGDRVWLNEPQYPGTVVACKGADKCIVDWDKGFKGYMHTVKELTLISTITEVKEEEVTMSKLLDKVLADSKHSDVQLVEKHSAKIIGNMENTLVNADTLEKIGAKKLIAMAVNLEDAEAEANKSQ